MESLTITYVIRSPKNLFHLVGTFIERSRSEVVIAYMKKPKQIHPADAYRMAQAQELIDSYHTGNDLQLDTQGKIVPSGAAFAHVAKEYVITDEVPPQHTKGSKQPSPRKSK